MSARAAGSWARRSPRRMTRFTAIEPSPTMRARLLRLPNPPAVLACGWEEAAIAGRLPRHCAGSNDARRHGAGRGVSCRAAAAGPAARSSGWSPRIAGRAVSALPAACRPRGTARTRPRRLDTTLRNLRPADRPHAIAVRRLDLHRRGCRRCEACELSRRAARLAAARRAPRTTCTHILLPQAKRRDGAVCLEIPRRSAVLVWRK